ncbi:MAG: carboxylesterase family protein [Phycisphaera sp.]|nr:carboxylesterase family protein [Phycisphaera sp.]
MIRLHILLAICASSLFTNGSAVAQSQSFVSIDVDGLNRRYLRYLPKGFDPSEKLPVMMWFHGGGGNADGGVFEADFRSLANSERFILVYPEAWPDELEACRCWGYDTGEGEANGNYEIDLAYASAMIDDLVANQNADRDRIYAGGYSMGASFVWDLACARSDQFAAIAPVAASMYLWTYEECSAGQPTAVCHILGTNDFYAPYNGASWVPSVADQNAYWVDKNEAEVDPEVVSIGGGVTRYTWAPAEGCHGFQHFRRQGGGHDVPSFATSAIWDFVSQYDIDGEIECGPDAIPGDLNGDGLVNAADLGLLVAAWSTPNADINGDGTTNSADLGLLVANWS